jgi:hypothetical protein
MESWTIRVSSIEPCFDLQKNRGAKCQPYRRVVQRNALTPLMERLYTRNRTFAYTNGFGLDLAVAIEQSWETQG